MRLGRGTGMLEGQSYPDDWSNELDQKSRYLEQRRVEVIEVVDEQSLDVRAIVILWKAFRPVAHRRNT